MTPWPGAHTTLDGEVLKLFRPRVTAASGGAAGVVQSADERGLAVGAGDGGVVTFAEAQLPNKKRLPVGDLVRGRPIARGARLHMGAAPEVADG
jgi:methionyl-tRNA formyltransferase